MPHLYPCLHWSLHSSYLDQNFLSFASCNQTPLAWNVTFSYKTLHCPAFQTLVYCVFVSHRALSRSKVVAQFQVWPCPCRFSKVGQAGHLFKFTTTVALVEDDRISAGVVCSVECPMHISFFLRIQPCGRIMPLLFPLLKHHMDICCIFTACLQGLYLQPPETYHYQLLRF